MEIRLRGMQDGNSAVKEMAPSMGFEEEETEIEACGVPSDPHNHSRGPGNAARSPQTRQLIATVTND